MLTNIYLPFLFVHNYLRWIVILTVAYSLFRALWGWIDKRNWGDADTKAGLFATISLDIQLTVGLVLYALGGFSVSIRFFSEHILTMTAAAVFAHLGSALPKKTASDPAKHRRAALWLGLSLLFILASIPWAKPWLRGL